MPDKLLFGLNEEQLEAVTYDGGPLMIIAGAGTGKTTVITQRISWLIEQGRAKPDEVLALTFTEKAATEMEERVDQLLPIGYVDLWISTFHAFCERVLRQHALEIGLPDQFLLLDEISAYLMIRRELERFELDYYQPRGNPTRFLRSMLKHISRLKDELITPDDYAALAAEKLANKKPDKDATDKENEEQLAEIAKLGELANAYRVYQDILLEQNALDFSDLISYTIELFRKRPDILKQYQEQFKYILVDEFQDTNMAQYALVKLLISSPDNITVVGDDDQSIYKFRGASLSNIMQFRADFPDSKRVVLTKNYRSGKNILDAAYKMIQQNNPNRLEDREGLNKELTAHQEHEGYVEHIHCDTHHDEVQGVMEKIVSLKKDDDTRWSDFVILVRANDNATPFLTSLEHAGIPYRFMAMSGLYTKPIIIDGLAFLRIIDQHHDGPSMFRILSHPTLGVGENDLANITMHARKKGISLFQALVSTPDISDEGKKRIDELLESLGSLETEARRRPASELFVSVMKQTGLLAGIRELPEPAQVEQFEFLQQFFARIKAFEKTATDPHVHHFLEIFDHESQAGEAGKLSTDIEAGPDVVNIMTVHASKGLEFRFVFLVNLVEQRFPSQRRADPIKIPEELVKEIQNEEGNPHIEEERRLFYVAMTRAKEGLFMFSAEDYGGVRKRKPSRFIQDANLEPQRRTGNVQRLGEEMDVEVKAGNNIPSFKPGTMSFTQLAAFSSCPLQYKFAHILHVPVFGRYQMSFGKTMHNSLQHFMERVVAAQQKSEETSGADTETPIEFPSLNILKEIYEANWIDEWYPDDDIREEYRQNGLDSLTAFHTDLNARKPKVSMIEKGFTLKIGEVTVKGRIDRIDEIEDGFEIVDYKTGSPKALEKIGWQEKRQLVLYALAAERCFDPPLKITKLTYHYLEDNSLVTFEPKQKDIEKLQQEVLGTVARMKESDFKATPGWNCKFCDFRDICEFRAG
ncbi:UvrD-helicase domain-containing protein [Candidatus Uhrbacteria bacterium]|jgi:DNA helicase II / ATP-dependent DNA helicase PcrA|nr:UvrD-helicase domain-containing protein [Candidatus Uhrbacteria bacterium]